MTSNTPTGTPAHNTPTDRDRAAAIAAHWTDRDTDQDTVHASESVLRAALGLTPERFAVPATIGAGPAPVTVIAAFGIGADLDNGRIRFIGQRPLARHRHGGVADIEYVVATWDGESPEWDNGRYFPATSAGIGKAWARFLRTVTELAADIEGHQRDAAPSLGDPAAAEWPGDWTADTAAEYGTGD